MTLRKQYNTSGLNKSRFCEIIGVARQNFNYYIELDNEKHIDNFNKYLVDRAKMIDYVFKDIDKKKNEKLSAHQNYLLVTIKRYLKFKKYKYFTVRNFIIDTHPYLSSATQKIATKPQTNIGIQVLIDKGFIKKEKITNKDSKCFVV